ncbi:MAG: archaellar assembly protein FlaJ [Thermoplasmatota archaeon]
MLGFRKSLQAIDLSVGDYVLRIALPLSALGVGAAAAMAILLPFLLQGYYIFLIIATPIFLTVVAALYPMTKAQQRRISIDRQIHFYVTHMGVLATSQLPRVEVLRILSEKTDYGPLAEESGKIYRLVHAWHMSLAEACRFVARRTASELYSEFLDRFAYALDSGEDLEGFLKNEQIVLMEEFLALYRRNLYGLENIKNLFNALILSIVFLIILAILMPVLLGIDATLMLTASLFVVGFIEIVFLYYTRARAPLDPIWYRSDMTSLFDIRVRRALPLSLIAIVVILALAIHLALPAPIVIASSLTPLMYVGLVASREEEDVKRREDNYAAFIRSLGASTSSRGGALKDALKHLQFHDFGPLTENIRRLYQRLTFRVNDRRAWEYFDSECGSQLIAKSSSMFVEGLRAGGKPDMIGKIISDNFVHLLTVRKARYQTASALRGILYGLIGGMAFALFIGLSILHMLVGLFQSMQVPNEDAILGPILHFNGNFALMSFIILLLLLLHSLTSSLMVKVADGGHLIRAYVDFVGMFWIVAGISVLANSTIGGILP